MGGLIGAITWNLITWYFGIPSSSSHALIGGLVGAAIASGSIVHWDIDHQEGRHSAVRFADGRIQPDVPRDDRDHVDLPARSNPGRVNRGFRRAQTFSAAAMALGHGLQDAQKTMGVIFLALLVGGYVVRRGPTAAVGGVRGGRRDLPGHLRRWMADHADVWVVASFTSTRLADSPPSPWPPRCSTRPPFVFEAPISTTHTITSSIMGAGATKRLSAVRGGRANIITAGSSRCPWRRLMAACPTGFLRLHSVWDDHRGSIMTGCDHTPQCRSAPHTGGRHLPDGGGVNVTGDRWTDARASTHQLLAHLARLVNDAVRRSAGPAAVNPGPVGTNRLDSLDHARHRPRVRRACVDAWAQCGALDVCDISPLGDWPQIPVRDSHEAGLRHAVRTARRWGFERGPAPSGTSRRPSSSARSTATRSSCVSLRGRHDVSATRSDPTPQLPGMNRWMSP